MCCRNWESARRFHCAMVMLIQHCNESPNGWLTVKLWCCASAWWYLGKMKQGKLIKVLTWSFSTCLCFLCPLFLIFFLLLFISFLALHFTSLLFIKFPFIIFFPYNFFYFSFFPSPSVPHVAFLFLLISPSPDPDISRDLSFRGFKATCTVFPL